MADFGDVFGGRKHWWVDLMVGAAVIWLGCAGLDAMATATTVRDLDETDHSLATALAAGERQRVEALDFAALEPTDGFVAPAWIDRQGLAPGEVALVTQPGHGDVGESRRTYAVTWKVDHVDRHGSLRRATISVHWQKPDGRLGRVVTSILRAGGDRA